jgi:hypothetical protein
MKKITKVFTVASISIFSAASSDSFAQQMATDGADAHASIVTPISITKVDDMNFGNIAVNASGGSVALPTSGPRNTTGGVTLPSTAGTIGAASFTVSGQPGYVYSITLPASITIADNAAHTMTINNLVSQPSVVAGGTLSGGGTQTLYVGGTLAVSGSQAPGSYSTTTPFDVSVVYN